MSIIRNRILKKAGLKTKGQKRKARRIVKKIAKCNRMYFI
jgi:hypothetical protein